MTDDKLVAQRIANFQELVEARFYSNFHQSVEKYRHKYWHDRHIKSKIFSQGDKVLLYNNCYQKHLGKLHVHWLVPFIVAEIRHSGAVKLTQLVGIL